MFVFILEVVVVLSPHGRGLLNKECECSQVLQAEAPRVARHFGTGHIPIILVAVALVGCVCICHPSTYGAKSQRLKSLVGPGTSKDATSTSAFAHA